MPEASTLSGTIHRVAPSRARTAHTPLGNDPSVTYVSRPIGIAATIDAVGPRYFE